MTKAELIRRIEALESVVSGHDEAVRHELYVHQEQLRAQNEQLKEAQQNLEASRDRYADLYDFAPLAYVTLDGQGVILEINLTGAALLGLERSRLIGRPMLIFIAEADSQRFLAHMRRCRDGKEPLSTELMMRSYLKRKFPAQLRTNCASDAGPGGVTVSFRTAITDLTESRRAEEERRELLLREHAARAAAEMKDQFMALVTHELRTPLSAILLWAKMLRAGTVPPEQHRQVYEFIEQSAVAQQRIIEDLLDTSRVLTGKLRLELREVELLRVISAAVNTVMPMAEARGVAIDSSTDESIGLVRIDPHRVQQIVWNLLANAVKFTDKGGRVSVRVRHLDGHFKIIVSDTGKGISPEFLPHVFERFRQADGSTTRTQGGLGLGLAIVKELVEMHGGEIKVESAGPGRGSTFTVRLPTHERTARTDADPSDEVAPAKSRTTGATALELEGVRALLVEDDPRNREAIQWVLEQSGAAVRAVESGSQAVEAFSEGLKDGGYSVIVSDIGMPEMSGYDLVREIRNLERQKRPGSRPIPAVALTAYAREEDRAQAIAAGFQSHLPKPVEPTELVAVIARLAVRSQGA